MYGRALSASEIQADMTTPVGSAGPPDTLPPSVPAGLSATPVSATQINLAWTASTDNVGVTGYRVERCQGAGCANFVQVATPLGRRLTTPGLAAATSYSYRVRAADAGRQPERLLERPERDHAGGPDTQPPSVPAGLTATAVSASQINLAWTASTDNVGVTGYRVERCQGAACSNFVQVATPPGASFSDTGLAPATTYSYRVRAADAAGNLSGYSSVQSATTQAGPDTQPPTVPSGLVGDGCVCEPDQSGLDGVDRQRRGDRLSGRALSGGGLLELRPGRDSDRHLASTTPGWRRRRATAIGCGRPMLAGNLSGYSSVQSATTQPAPDTQAPSVPSGLSATAVSASQINLAWTASTDNVGVTGYRVERCQGAGCSNFVQVATPTGASFNDTGLAAATSYSYRVRAADAAGNLSGYSSVQSATTQAGPDTQPPSVPTGLVGDAGVREPDQSGLDGVDRQRGGDGLSG